MYLVVFMFLLISVVGLHMQVYMMEASKMFDRETSMAQSMISWHKASEGIVEKSAAIGNDAVGCNLSTAAAPAATPPYPPVCPSLCPGAAGLVACQVLDPSLTNLSGDRVSTLPNGYNFTTYKWRSVAYTPASGVRFVATYAQKPTNARGAVTVPAIGLTLSQLFKQFQALEVSVASYGIVVPIGEECNGVVVAGASKICLQSGMLVDAPADTIAPTQSTIPDGSLVVLTSK